MAEIEIPDPVMDASGILPSIDSGSGALDDNAKLIWTMVRYTALDTPVRPAQHEGEEGYLFSGALARVLVETWPPLRTPSALVQSIRMEINRYLRLTHNLVCLDRGSVYGGKAKDGKRKEPLWWVRASWNDRKDHFRVHSNWDGVAAVEPDEDATVDLTDDVLGDAPVSVQDFGTASGAHLFVCDHPGCDQGEDGAPFSSPRANVMPLHRRGHATADAIVEAAARIMAAGLDFDRVTLAALGRLAGTHQTTISTRFNGREELRTRAERLLNERGREAFEPLPETYESVSETEEAPTTSQLPVHGAEWDLWRVRILRLVAFAERNGTPLTERGVDDVCKYLDPATRGALTLHLLTSGEMIESSAPDSRQRQRLVWKAADPDAVLADLNLSAAPVASPVTAGVDYVAALKGLLEEYAARHDMIQAKNAALAAKDVLIEDQSRLIDEARSELHTLRELIAPLMNFAGGPKS